MKNRTEQPYGAKQTEHVKPECYNLHTRDPWRGITWYDKDGDICWLVGATSQHDYALFETRSVNNEIIPTAEDYADLAQVLSEEEEGVFIDRAASEAPDLMARATATPNQEHRALIAGTLDTGVFVELLVIADEGDIAEVYVSFQMPPLAGVTLPPDFCEAVFWLLAPEADDADVLRNVDTHPRPGGRRPGEIIYCWRKP